MDVNLANEFILLLISLFCMSPRIEKRYNLLIGLSFHFVFLRKALSFDMGRIIQCAVAGSLSFLRC